MIKRFCDMCNKELGADVRDNIRIGAWVRYKHQDKDEDFDSYKSFAFDVCNDCSHKVIAFITGEDMSEVMSID